MNMGGKIEAYIDLSSLYSYVGFVQLQNVQNTLRSYSVEVEYHPFFLGGVNAGSGNKPPWLLPAKAAYLKYDSQRSLERVGLAHVRAPKDLMVSGMTVLPLRALSFIKSQYPRETFETAFLYLFHRFWTPPNANLSDPTNLAEALTEARAGFQGIDSLGDPSAPLFSQGDVTAIMQATTSQEMKDLVKNKTQEALSRGAFGAPWLWVTNPAGVSEPFFGSDRFHFIYKFLGLPYQDVSLIPPNEDASGSRPKL